MLNGTQAGDNLYGLDGDDTLSGGGGSDTLIGGAGVDILRGGVGVAAQASNGDDTYVWSRGDGNDKIEEYSNSFAEVDTLVLTDVDSKDVTLRRVDGYQELEIIISPSNETIYVSQQFADYATKSWGLEAIEFRDGVTWSRDDIAAKTKSEGTAGNDTMVGTEAGDNIYGMDGDDTLESGAGDDTLIGGAGVDILRGGAGIAAQVSNGSDTYVWSRGDGNDKIEEYSNSFVEVDTLQLLDVQSKDVTLRRVNGYEELEIIVSQSDEDTSTGQPSPSDETIYVSQQFADYATKSWGLEAIEFGDGVIWSRDDIAANTRAEGTAGDDVLNGTQAGDNLYGLDGDDTLVGGDGDDTLDGGADSDSVFGENGSDNLTLGTGNDKGYGGFGNDEVHGGDGNDEIWGDTEQITIFVPKTKVLNDFKNWGSEYARIELGDVNGDGRADIVGNNHVSGIHVSLGQSDGSFGSRTYLGNDWINWGHPNNRMLVDDVNGDGRADIVGVHNEAGVYVSLSDSAKDTLFGDDGDDIMNGGFGEDILRGGAGADILIGGDGDDRLIGGLDSDTLTGSSGEDRFEFTSDEGDDIITDFAVNEDLIVFHIQDLAFEELALTEIGGDTTIDYGSGSITLDNVASITLDEQDFVFA